LSNFTITNERQPLLINDKVKRLLSLSLKVKSPVMFLSLPVNRTVTVTKFASPFEAIANPISVLLSEATGNELHCTTLVLSSLFIVSQLH
jgi:hypothetical protein